ncbi:MAG: prepilin-type N-terminal cleavage/methylation domain-containing protein [Candidatus Omnitrophica bacterium]|nr:prepilin-type N-terminal cleavage/methylation domain-containing protein [Candidatus Omnitrophota bacterium]
MISNRYPLFAKRLKGFTLIELIVVIAIIAILAAIITPNVFRAIEKSKVTRAVEDIRAIKAAALAFYGDLGLWPGSQWGTMPTDPYSPAEYGEGFVTTAIVHSGTVMERARAQTALSNWDGPYLEKWMMTPWAMPYMWDFNNWDASGDGIPNEHVVWFDLAHSGGTYDQNNKVPPGSRDKIDQIMDGGDGLHTGMVQEMNSAFYGTSLMVIVVQGY